MPTLHHAPTLQALLPLYASRFKCTGPQCEDSCCSGWQVNIDKTTYQAYQQIADPKLGPRLAHNLVRQPDAAHDLEYGRIALQAGDHECPLLEERLCTVHKTMGDSYLSHTCFTYPRISNEFGGQFEQTLALSCPEAARLALLAPDAFDFVEGSVSMRLDVVKHVRAKNGFSPELLGDLRIFCLNLVRTEGLALWQRLAILGVFCESASAAIESRDNAVLRALLDNFVAVIEQGGVLDALAGLQPDHAAQAMVFSTLWGGKGFVTRSATQNQVVDAVAKGLGADPDTGRVTSEQLLACYRRGLERLPEALQGAPHLLEHYLLNEMFRTLFPFDAATPYQSFLRLVSRFGLLRLMLAAQCNTDGPLPDAAALVRTVQVHCRRFDHDTQFANQVNEALQTSGWARLEKLYGFLRD